MSGVTTRKRLATLSKAKKLTSTSTPVRKLKSTCKEPATDQQSTVNHKKTKVTRSASLKKKSVNKSSSTLQVPRKFFKSTQKKYLEQDIQNVQNKVDIAAKKSKTRQIQKKKQNVDASFRLRQTTLKESFARSIVARRLRPRKNVRGNHDNSSKQEEGVSVQKQDDAEASEVSKNVKVPVYKALQRQEDLVNSPGHIYDFVFDSNDSKEKIVKKKRQRVVRKRVQKGDKENRKKKHAVVSKNVTNSNKNEKETRCCDNVGLEMNSVQTDQVDHVFKNSIEIQVNVESAETLTKRNVETQSKGTTASEKLKIISVENVDIPIKIVSTPPRSNVASLAPFRATNVFHKKSTDVKKIINHSLFNKSLSPISKINETFDTGSPWRMPISSTFSRVKSAFQSTPRLKTSSVDNKRDIKELNQPKASDIVKETDSAKHNTNKITSMATNNNIYTKNDCLKPRKFGTEITNKKHSQAIINTSKNTTMEVKENVENEMLMQSSSHFEANNSNSSIASESNVVDDKENTVPNHQSPKKLQRKRTKISNTSQILQAQNVLQNLTQSKENENTKSQSGSINVQQGTIKDQQILCEVQKTLRQSSLNTFLNLPDKPESTKIDPTLGIFGDAHSTPIQVKWKKTEENKTNSYGAFGFSDSESDLDASPVEIDTMATQGKTKSDKIMVVQTRNKLPRPARLLIGEIKNRLLPTKTQGKESGILKKANLKKESDRIANAQGKVLNQSDSDDEAASAFDITSFSDTFDILSEQGESAPKKKQDFSLFADLEPTHFKTPPRYSYKRKRVEKYEFSENSDAQDDENYGEVKRKKKRLTKLNKEEKKRVQQWIKNVNETFEEIDEHDLLVE